MAGTPGVDIVGQGLIGGLAVLAAAAGAKAATHTFQTTPTVLADGYDLVFLMAAGLALTIAASTLLLPRHRTT